MRVLTKIKSLFRHPSLPVNDMKEGVAVESSLGIGKGWLCQENWVACRLMIYYLWNTLGYKQMRNEVIGIAVTKGTCCRGDVQVYIGDALLNLNSFTSNWAKLCLQPLKCSLSWQRV